MQDFYFEMKDALDNRESGNLERLIGFFNADPNLDYRTSPEIVTISSVAFFESEGGENSLGYIFNQSLGEFSYEQSDGEKGIYLAKEIAFTGIFNEKELRIYEYIMGNKGDKDGCSWDEGNLLDKSHLRKKKLNASIMLGHVHPVIVPDGDNPKRIYGAIPSWVPFTKENVEGYVKNNSIYQAILDSGLHEKYGWDYCEILTRAKEDSAISHFSMIMSPALDQLGIFEVKDKGRIVYHPWKIG